MKKFFHILLYSISLLFLVSPQAKATLWNVDENFTIEYQLINDETELQFRFTLENELTGWMGICFHSFMFPADCIVAWWDPKTNTPKALDTYNPGIPTLPVFPAPLQDTDPIITLQGASPLDNKNNLTNITGTNNNGVITISVQRKLQTGDIFDFQFEPGMQLNVVSAYNQSLPWNDNYNAQQPSHTKFGATRMVIPGNTDLEQ